VTQLAYQEYSSGTIVIAALAGEPTVSLSSVSWSSFPVHRRNGLATSCSNCYFSCQKVGSTNQISERCHMTAVKPKYVMHLTVAVTPFHFNSDCSIALV